MNDNVYLTIRQISLMQHALGLDDGEPIRYQRLVYRNYFDAGESIKAWENLVGKGLAIRNICRDGSIEYCVTDAGIKALERIMLVKFKFKE